MGKQLGNTMLNKHLSSFAPSIRALSKVELGIPLMNCIIKKILSAPPPKKAGTTKGFSVPSEWKELNAEREFRGARYFITYRRGEEKGTFVDGKKVDGNKIPLFEKGTEHQITVLF